MALVRTRLIPVGTHHSPDGVVEATPPRIRRWVDSFRKLQSEGVQFPVSWGHHLAARPADGDGIDTGAFVRSRFNAGYVHSLDCDSDGCLSAVIDAPGIAVQDGRLVSVATLPGGTPVTTAIGEVSAAVGDWTDGKARTHKDILNHIALTPLPVVAGQSGFTALSTLTAQGQVVSIPAGEWVPKASTGAKLVCLSTRTLGTVSGVQHMATKPDEKNPKKPPTPEDKDGNGVVDSVEKDGPQDVPDVSDEEFDDLADELSDPTDEPAEAEVAAEEPVVNPDVELISRAKAALSHAGLDIPDLGGEPDLKQFIEHLVVAVTALNSQAAAAAKEPTVTEKPAARPVEESPPIMMSTLTPDAQKLAGQLERAQQKKRSKRIDQLIKRGLNPARADKLRTAATQQRLSLTANLQPSKGEIDRTLDLLEEVLPQVAPHLQKLGTKAVEHENPLAANELVDCHGDKLPKAAADEVDKMLELSTGKPKSKTKAG